MAGSGDITAVRSNTGLESDDAKWTDTALSNLIDALGVAGASASVWRAKSARFVEDGVDVTEGGASHKFSDLHKNALAMAKYWDGQVTAEVEAETPSGPRVNDIVRES